MFLISHTDFPYDDMTLNLLAKWTADYTSIASKEGLSRNKTEVMVLVEIRVKRSQRNRPLCTETIRIIASLISSLKNSHMQRKSIVNTGLHTPSTEQRLEQGLQWKVSPSVAQKHSYFMGWSWVVEACEQDSPLASASPWTLSSCLSGNSYQTCIPTTSTPSSKHTSFHCIWWFKANTVQWGTSGSPDEPVHCQNSVTNFVSFIYTRDGPCLLN